MMRGSICPLNIKQENLTKGIDIIEAAVQEVCGNIDKYPDSADYFDDVVISKKKV